MLGALGTGCAMGRPSGAGQSDQFIDGTGPKILSARTQPGTVVLNRDLQPALPAEIFAEVSETDSEVRDVRIAFIEVPLEIKMERIEGALWRVQLTPEQIHELAIGNQTTPYKAHIYAKDDKGRLAVSRDPLKVEIQAPDLAPVQRS